MTTYLLFFLRSICLSSKRSVTVISVFLPNSLFQSLLSDFIINVLIMKNENGNNNNNDYDYYNEA